MLRGMYWDDWVLADISSSELETLFSMAGKPPSTWIHQGLFFLAPYPTGHRILSFACFLGTTLGLHGILTHIPGSRLRERILIPLLSITLPLYIARPFSILSIANWTHAAFFLGLWLAVRPSRGARIPTLASGLLFGMSFYVESHNIWVPLAFLFLLWVSWKKNEKLTLSPGQFLFVTLLSLLTFQIGFPKPWGAHASYNKILITSLFQNLLRLPWHVKIFVKGLYVQIGAQLSLLSLAVALVLTGLSLRICQANPDDERGYERGFFFTIFGTAMIFLGLIPYWTAGKVPLWWGVDSRHQLLAPEGCALVVFGILDSFTRRFRTGPGIRRFLFAVLLCTSASSQLHLYRGFELDWLWQVSLQNYLRNSKLLTRANEIEVLDHTKGWLAIHRSRRFYELTGLASTVDPSASTFIHMIGPPSFGDVLKGYEWIYNLENHRPKAGPKIRLEVLPHTLGPQEISILAMKYWARKDPERFRQELSKLFRYVEKVVPASQDGS